MEIKIWRGKKKKIEINEWAPGSLEHRSSQDVQYISGSFRNVAGKRMEAGCFNGGTSK